MDKAKLTTNWDLTRHYYLSPKDIQIEKDMRYIEKSVKAFANKYKKDKKHLKSPKALLAALKAYVDLLEIAYDPKPMFYIHFLKDIDSSNTEVQATMQKIFDRVSKISNEILFFTLEIAKIPAKEQKAFLSNKDLKPFKYFLERTFTDGKYTLSEAEEKIINLKSGPAHRMWVNGHDKILTNTEVTFKGEKHFLEHLMSKIPAMPKAEDRYEANKICTDACKEISKVSELELNAIIADKKIEDELRGYKNPYHSRAWAQEVTVKDIDTLSEIVTKHFNEIAPKFYSLKARLLGMPKIHAVDRAVPIGNVQKKYSYEEAATMVCKSLEKIDPEFGKIAWTMCTQGQVDALPKKGKTGGGYNAHGVNRPTYILLNHADQLRDVVTIAHELGHAVHSELCKGQLNIYQNFSIVTAEVMSTFFEGVFFDDLLKTLNIEEQIIAKEGRMRDLIATIQAQIAFHNFEKAMHEEHAQKGFVDKETLAKMYVDFQKKSTGDSVIFDENDGYKFTTHSHMRLFFYVFAYAYSGIISMALLKRYKEDPKKTVEQIKEIMKFGGSATPKDLFKKVGLDITSPRFFEDGIAYQRKLLADFTKEAEIWLASKPREKKV